MDGNKKILIFLAAAVLTALIALGTVLYLITHVVIDFHSYPRNAQVLDLREEEISVEHYEKLRAQMPGCEIHWNIPFQGGLYPEDTETLKVTALSQEDLRALGCFTQLKTLDAAGCADYENLLAFQENNPQVEVRFEITLSGQTYSNDQTKVELAGLSREEVPLLDCFRDLKTLVLGGGTYTDSLEAIEDYCAQGDVELLVTIGGKELPTDRAAAELTGVTQEEMALLSLLPELKQVTFLLPEADAQSLIAYREENPQIQVTWEQEICGVRFSCDVEEVDLSEGEITSLEEVEEAMAYFPDAQSVFLGECGLENDDIAGYRDRVREDYKVVWTVRFGGVFPTRTDTKIFAPGLKGCPVAFTDKISYNLRYCEDIVCMDLGHMGGISDVSFLAYMPNLEYLILAHTSVQYIDAISNCKKLKFLELDWSGIKDLAPLAGCTSLEDLNFGNTWPEVDGILGMTWLKNVYMIFGSSADAHRIAQALPDTTVITSGTATVASGWRRLPNYYAMRDCLGEPYMN